MSENDAHLREHFEALRRRDLLRAPGFEATLAAASRRPRPRLPWLLAATAAGVALLVLGRGGPPPPAPGLAISGWRTPTDVLLETPGSELLGSPVWDPLTEQLTTPEIGPQSRIRARSHG